MRIRFVLAVLTLSVFPMFAGSAYAQASLNEIRLEACGATSTLNDLIQKQERRGLVIDARPSAVNQSSGQVSFEGKTARVSVAHMNPFVYQYTISVTQQELTSSAVTDFIDILLPPALRLGGPAEQAAEKMKSAERTARSKEISSSSPIARRLDRFNPGDCNNPNDDGCVALKTMHAQYVIIKDAIAAAGLGRPPSAPPAFATFKSRLIDVRNEETDAVQTCENAAALHTFLIGASPGTILDSLNGLDAAIKEITLNANDLAALADKFTEDDGLSDYVVRCGGFNCVTEFRDYANSVVALMDLYTTDLAELIGVAESMQRTLDFTTQMRTKEGVFARSFDVTRKFEFSAATISVARAKLEANGARPDTEADEQDDDTQAPGRHHLAAAGLSTTTDDGDKKDDDKDDDKEKKKDKEDTKKQGNALTADINESIQIGRPRFLISGGLVFSPLRRQTFEPVTGFTRDADGNPTGDGDKSVVGLGENSPRRLLPMVMLNTRLSSFKPTSLYFSLGVTAKHDDNVDVEYLLGPSVSMLNDRALFTFGGYVGKVQHLVPDVKVGDEIPESAGDAKLFTKRNTWKPGFSFTYVFSKNERSGESFTTSGGDNGGKGKADLKNEIRIGGVPFNLAMGLAYTSLEERTYDEIVGFARDRNGNLTDGEKLTRIVGITSSSGYRLAPLVLLHTRLLNFGRRSFYFSTGVTGKKTDDKVQVEYLLGGTVNAYRRKIFLTFGAFAGKQNVLGGDFFLGAKLDKDQSVPITSRYVWKPGFAISYDISRILRSDDPR